MKLECPACGDTYLYDHRVGGSTFRCKYCGGTIRVPALVELDQDDRERYQSELQKATHKELSRLDRERQRHEKENAERIRKEQLRLQAEESRKKRDETAAKAPPAVVPSPQPAKVCGRTFILVTGLFIGVALSAVVLGAVFLVTRRVPSETANAETRPSPVDTPAHETRDRWHQEIDSDLEAARQALRAVERIQARLEVGVPQAEFAQLVGETWAETKPFIESSVTEYLYAGGTKLDLGAAMKEYREAVRWQDDSPHLAILCRSIAAGKLLEAKRSLAKAEARAEELKSRKPSQ